MDQFKVYLFEVISSVGCFTSPIYFINASCYLPIMISFTIKQFHYIITIYNDNWDIEYVCIKVWINNKSCKYFM